MRLLQRTAWLCAVSFLPLSFFGQATYWGMTSAGGASDAGVIYTITEANVFTKKYDLTRIPGGHPIGELLRATNGLYYGVTETGGTGSLGTLFSYNATTGAYTTLANFTSSTGSTPSGGVVQAANGHLYGLCSGGGANGHGSLYEFNITTGVLTRRVSFTGTNGNGSQPAGRLALSSDGTVLWGTTQAGGANTNNTGCLFQYTQGAASVVVRFTFGALAGNTTGRIPRGLVRATNNRYYGITVGGGTGGFGTAFEFNPTGLVFTVLQSFSGANGKQPFAAMTEGATNVLYGVTTTGGANDAGTLFKLDVTGTAAFTKVHDFAVTASNPQGRLLKAANGLLYGTTADGGTNADGVLYTFNMTSNAWTAIADLGVPGFDDMEGGLVEETAGTFLGLSNSGGQGNGGALFRYVASSGVFTELVPFSFSAGHNPRGRLLKASNGLFYGLCNSGGTATGTLFSFDPATSAFTRRYDFNATSGMAPLGTPIEVGGKLYGLCSAGGTAAGGSLFEYTIGTNTLVKKQDLTTATGTLPENGLVRAANGRLYGMTSTGGDNGLGTLFQYVPGTNTLTVLRHFTAADGTAPKGDLYEASNGLLYGTMSENGQFADGTLFSFNTANNAFTVLYSFDGLQGGAPAGDLVQAPNGKLYGMCSDGGAFFSGCIFSWNVASAAYTEEYDMTTTPPEGAASESNLVVGTDGLLYGTCSAGGTNGVGVVFRFNPTSLAYTVLQTFSGVANGSSPFDGLTKETTPAAGAVLLAAKVFLDGPFNSTTGLMADGVRTLPDFPLTEPNTAAGFTQVGGGGETIAPGVLAVTGNNAIVDWVLVELRDKTNNASVVRTRSALLQRDGDVVDLDGTSTLSIPVAADNYFIAVRHRNHFGVMTLASVALGASSTTVDFTNGSRATFGTDAQKIVGSVRTNWCGNVVRDNIVKYLGTSNDRDPILGRVGGSVPTATATGYFKEDVNLDGTVKYLGSSNDRDRVLNTVGGSVPTAVRLEQMP